MGGRGAPRAAAAFAVGQTGCPGCGGTCWPQGCEPARLLYQQLLPSPAGAVPATGFLKQSGINIDSKGFIVVNKVSMGQPLPAGEQEELGLFQGLLQAKFPQGSKLLWQGQFICQDAGSLTVGCLGAPASEGFANHSPGCWGLGPSQIHPGMVGISGGKEMEKDPSFQGSQRISSFPSTTSDSNGRSAGAAGWCVP